MPPRPSSGPRPPVRNQRARYLADAEQLAHDHALDIDNELTRVEYAEAVATGLRRQGPPRAGKEELADLLRNFWDSRGPDFRPSLLAFARNLARQPETALVWMDELRSEAPAVLGLLWDLLEAVHHDRPDPITRAVIGKFVASRWWENYAEFRIHLLKFCLAELISPMVVAWAIQHRAQDEPDLHLPIQADIAADWAMLSVYLAGEMAAG